MRAPFQRDAPFFCSLGAWPKDSISAPRGGARPTRPRAWPLPPGPGSGLRTPIPQLAVSEPCAPAAPALCPASPSDSRGSLAPPSRAGQSALPAPALARTAANERARHGPPPPRGWGRRGGGRVRPPRAEEQGARRRDREGRSQGSGLWKREAVKDPIKPEGSPSLEGPI